MRHPAGWVASRRSAVGRCRSSSHPCPRSTGFPLQSPAAQSRPACCDGTVWPYRSALQSRRGRLPSGNRGGRHGAPARTRSGRLHRDHRHRVRTGCAEYACSVLASHDTPLINAPCREIPFDPAGDATAIYWLDEKFYRRKAGRSTENAPLTVAFRLRQFTRDRDISK